MLWLVNVGNYSVSKNERVHPEMQSVAELL